MNHNQSFKDMDTFVDDTIKRIISKTAHIADIHLNDLDSSQEKNKITKWMFFFRHTHTYNLIANLQKNTLFSGYIFVQVLYYISFSWLLSQQKIYQCCKYLGNHPQPCFLQKLYNHCQIKTEKKKTKTNRKY